jgi:WD40 repeat protein
MSNPLVPLRSPDWQANLGDAVAEVSWSADGSTVVAGGVDGRVALFPAAGGPLRQGFNAHAHGLFRCRCSPTEPLLATAGQDGLAKLWDPQSGALLKELAGGSAWVEQLSWAPRGKWLAFSAGKKFRLWNPTTGVVHESADHRSTVGALAFLADGSRLASACYGGVELWDVEGGRHLEHLPWKTSLVSLSWSPDGRWVVAGTQELAVQIWELPFRPGEELAMSGYPAKVRELAWHYSSRYLATGGGPEIMVWDCNGKGPAGSTPRILQGHGGKVTALSYQSAGHLLASGGTDACVFLWNAGKSSSPLRQFKLPAAITSVAWSPDGSRFVTGCRDGTVAVGSA